MKRTSDLEWKLAMGIGGAALLLFGLTRRSVAGAAASAAGGLLLGAALSSDNADAKKQLDDRQRACKERMDYEVNDPRGELDAVDEAMIESFPASDPPSYGGGFT